MFTLFGFYVSEAVLLFTSFICAPGTELKLNVLESETRFRLFRILFRLGSSLSIFVAALEMGGIYLCAKLRVRMIFCVHEFQAIFVQISFSLFNLR